MIDYRFTLTILLILVSQVSLSAKDSVVVIKGQVIQGSSLEAGIIMVLNMRLGTGEATNPDGSFEIEIRKSDQLKIFCRGFKTVSFSVKDSVYRPIYNITIQQPALKIKIKPVIVRPPPEFDEVEEAKEKIESFKYEPLVEQGFSGFSSPITALYQIFSKQEKNKRAYIELLNQDAYKEALKKIIGFFTNADLFDLDEDEYDDFIDYCNLSRQFVKKGTMYEVGVVMTKCYEDYKQLEAEKRY